MKPRILALADWYLPGQNGGGLVSALTALISASGDEFDFHVFTRDRDFRARRPYTEVPLEQWVTQGKARVLYTSDLSLGRLRRRILEVAPDFVYLNSFFSLLTVKTLWLRRLGCLPPIRVVLAPRGELAPGAIANKPIRKRAYIFAARLLRLMRGIVWQASSQMEEGWIRLVAGNNAAIEIVRDVPDPSFFGAPRADGARAKVPGAARFVFLSRISRNKNLDFALRLLRSIGGRIEFEIRGPVGDRGYWSECEPLLAAISGGASANYRGAVPREDVPAVLREAQFLLLPTRGENFGYAILEALAAGCPAVVSDQTPWRDLENSGAGWALPLGDADRWREVLERCVAMDAETYTAMSARARQYARDWIASTPFKEEHRRLFQRAARAHLRAERPEKTPLPSP